MDSTLDMINENKNILYIPFRIVTFLAWPLIILAFALNSCSPSGLKKKNAFLKLNDKGPANTIIKENLARDIKGDTIGYEKIESNGDEEIKKSNDTSENDSSEKSVKVISWNLEDFGKSKSDEVISFIANTVKDFDIVSIQEVVAGYGGAQAVAHLNDELNRKGTTWDYRVSDPTSGENSYKRERYAFLWKPSRVKIIGQPWLEIEYTNEINREPFFCTFNLNGELFTLVNFHAITKRMQPETEIKFFKFLPAEYSDKNLIFSGDFNCPQSHTVFNPLKKMGYKPIFEGQKTTLKMESINDECLASEFDNIFYYVQRVNLINFGVIKFYESFSNLTEARTVSDHIPIWFQFSLN